jgi:hypothetical protein
VLPVRRHQIDTRFGFADQQVHQFVGAQLFAPMHQRQHGALVIGQVQLRKLGVHGLDRAQQAGLLERHAPVAAFLADPQAIATAGNGGFQCGGGVGKGAVFGDHCQSMRYAGVASRCGHRDERAGVMEAGGSSPEGSG